MKRLTLLFVVGLATAFSSAQRGWGQAEDRIVGPDGRPTNGTITSMSPSLIVIGTKTFNVNEIKELNFAGEPAELRPARNRIREGNYNSALTELKKIDIASVKQDKIKREIEYFVALCNAKMSLSGEGNVDKVTAVAALRKFVDESMEDPAYAQTYHYYEAAEVVGDLAMAMGGETSFKGAEKYYTKLMEAPRSWGDFLLRGKIRVAQAQLAQGKIDDAKASFELVAGSPLATTEANRMKMFAKVGQARCLADSNPSQGITLIQEIIKTEDPKDMELFGLAYNAMGACHLKAGKNQNALLAFLHTDILFYKDPNTHAEALFHLVDLWQKVDKHDRATRARNTLRARYAGTRWAQ